MKNLKFLVTMLLIVALLFVGYKFYEQYAGSLGTEEIENAEEIGSEA